MGDPPAQQPVAQEYRIVIIIIPVLAVQPFLQYIGDTLPDIRHWLLSFKTYLDCVEDQSRRWQSPWRPGEESPPDEPSWK